MSNFTLCKWHVNKWLKRNMDQCWWQPPQPLFWASVSHIELLMETPLRWPTGTPNSRIHFFPPNTCSFSSFLCLGNKCYQNDQWPGSNPWHHLFLLLAFPFTSILCLLLTLPPRHDSSLYALPTILTATALVWATVSPPLAVQYLLTNLLAPICSLRNASSCK